MYKLDTYNFISSQNPTIFPASYNYKQENIKLVPDVLKKIARK